MSVAGIFFFVHLDNIKKDGVFLHPVLKCSSLPFEVIVK